MLLKLTKFKKLDKNMLINRIRIEQKSYLWSLRWSCLLKAFPQMSHE
jgi:hypothetical protein